VKFYLLIEDVVYMKFHFGESFCRDIKLPEMSFIFVCETEKEIMSYRHKA